MLLDKNHGICGHGIGRLGFGGAALGGLFEGVSDAAAEKTLGHAWDLGVRLFDTAPHYGRGRSEVRIGCFLSGLPRESYFLSTKVGRVQVPRRTPWKKGEVVDGFLEPLSFDQRFDYSRDGILSSFERSLERLKSDYIDLLLVHDIGRLTHGDDHGAHWYALRDSGLEALGELRASGAVRHIGLGVNEWQVCRDLLAVCQLDYILLAGRGTLLDQSGIVSLYPECQRLGVRVLAAAPFNSGVLARGSADLRGAHYDYAGVPDEIRARLLVLEDVCRDHGVSLRAAALRYPLLHPAVEAVVTGFRTPREVEEAVQAMAADIPPRFWADLADAGVLAWVPDAMRAEGQPS